VTVCLEDKYTLIYLLILLVSYYVELVFNDIKLGDDRV